MSGTYVADVYTVDKGENMIASIIIGIILIIIYGFGIILFINEG